jgi:ABC-type antimicrobial peptide transport system permease subunit
MDPAGPFLVVDRAALELVDYALWGRVEVAQEWWLGIEPGSDSAVTAALNGGPFSLSSLLSRAQLERSKLADPVGLGVIGALTLGSIAALVLAVIGFLVTIAFMTRERLGELALLRALGESTGTVRAMLAAEAAFLLAYGLIVGAGLGLLLGWLAIPASSLTTAGAAALPPPSIVVPWETLGLFGIPTLVGLAIAAATLVRFTAGTEIAPALRARDVT